ncbi:MAG: DNA repair protein RecO [Kiritimatiellaceae bacterium]|nr:DNA repair protein RecO [Kiritimatiellaceae bacterium]
MIVKTSAIPLYWTDVSNTSRIVTWLTAHYGKISTNIKGDQRKNSLFRGQYDHFSTSELLFYNRTERGVHIAKECSMLHPRPLFRTNWRACASASYISSLFAKTTLRHGHESGRFEFFEEMLATAEDYGQHPEFLIWFDLKFAEFQGHLMQLNDTPRDVYRFSAEHGGIIDPGYAREHRIPASPLAPEALDLLIAWQEADTPEEILSATPNPAHVAQIERLMEKFITYQFDLPPHVRKTATAILKQNLHI